jgi:hypothetical protein
MNDSELIDALNDPDVLTNLDYDPVSGRWLVRLHSERWSREMTARDAISMAATMASLNRETAALVATP